MGVGHAKHGPINITSIIKTQERATPFVDGILGKSWWRYFKARHLELSLRMAQRLEVTRARGLSNENVTSFYDNLEKLYKLHDNELSHIWNCDELGVQA